MAARFDIDRIRAQFPALSLPHDSEFARTYLDNPAGTQVPNQVLDRMRTAMVECNANMHGNFRTTREATALVDEAHAAMADFYNARSPREIVFGPNMTTLTFMMTRVLGPQFREGDELVTTHMEHDGNNTPWRIMAQQRGVVVKTLPFDPETSRFDLSKLDELITPRTRFAALNMASNLLGTINDIKSMCNRLRAVGALTYIDAVQYAPHGAVDVQDLGCDFLVSSAYKWYGPHQGILWGREELLQELRAYKLSVVADEPPGKFETGTQSLEGQAGVLGAIEYFQWISKAMGLRVPDVPGLRKRTCEIYAAMNAMVNYEAVLSERLVNGLQTIKGVTIHGITDPAQFDWRVPTVSFTHTRVAPEDIARYLDGHGVYVWNGHNYALPVVQYLGIGEGGVVRVGPTHYNTVEEIDRTVQLIDRCISRASGR